MSAVANFMTGLIDWLEPLENSSADDASRKDLLSSLDPETEGASQQAGSDFSQKISNGMQSLRKRRDDAEKDGKDGISDLTDFLKELRLIWVSLEDFFTAGRTHKAFDPPFSHYLRVIATLMATSYLRKKAPFAAAYGDAIGALTDEGIEVQRAIYAVLPFEAFRPDSDDREDTPFRWTKAAFLNLSVLNFILLDLGEKLQFDLGSEVNPDDAPDFKRANILARRVLSIYSHLEKTDGDVPVDVDANVVLSFLTVPMLDGKITDSNKPDDYEIVVTQTGKMKFEAGKPADKIRMTAEADLGAAGIFGWSADGVVPNDIRVAASVFYDLNDPAKKDSEGFKPGKIEVTMRSKPVEDADPPKNLLEAKLGVTGIGFAISGKNRDGFLKKILPDKPKALTTDFAVGWRSDKGVFFKSADFEKLKKAVGKARDFLKKDAPAPEPTITDLPALRIPINRSLFGVLEFPVIYLGGQVTRSPEDKIIRYDIFVSTQVKLNLGPFMALVDNLGIELGLDTAPKDGRGNLGSLDLSVGFKPPNGIGFMIDVPSVITGGGFLHFDTDRHEYFGAAELTIAERFSVKAIGIILTRLPGGKPGYSFLLIVTVEFTPAIQLGMGFALKGLGAMIGLHRAINKDGLRASVREGSLDRIMFPNDPVGEAAEIIGSLNTIFPVKENYYAFGLLGRIEWSGSSFVDLKAGLFFEVRSSGSTKLASIVLAGVVQVKVPEVLQIRVDFAGIFDFERKFISFDAYLVDSKILTMELYGDVALRARYGKDPVFVLSVGGFHPSFQPPGDLMLPTLRRIGVSLIEGDNLNVRLEQYLAVTSNTFQIGARVDFFLKFSKFKVMGMLGFDALFQFSPFRFEAALRGALGVYWGDRRLFGLSFEAVLSGPSEWRLAGYVSFDIWIFSYSHHFDKTWGQPATSQLQQENILEKMALAVGDNANWRLEAPAARPPQVLLREADAASAAPGSPAIARLLSHPNTRLVIVQQVAPLETRITMFAGQRVNAVKKYRLGVAGQETPAEDDFFAPAQFIVLEDAEKITRKSYEAMPAGIRISNFEVKAGAVVQSDFDYEEEIVDPLYKTPTLEQPAKPLGADFFNQLLRNNSVAHSPAGRRAIQLQENKRGQQLSPPKEEFVVADALTGNQLKKDVLPPARSMTQAYDDAWAILKDPTQKAVVRLPVVVPKVFAR